MKVYRDCATEDGAPLDDPASITIWEFNGNNPTQYGAPLAVQLSTDNLIPPVLDSPCLEPPPGLCVQEGTYLFPPAGQDPLNLPFNPDGYVIAYQRCCRNTTINNILAPGTVGATYTVTLTEEAQLKCNNSPIFNDFPPIVICANEPINFDHSATDNDGDSLVYKFCEPTVGASSNIPAPMITSVPFVNFPHFPTVNFSGPFTFQAPLQGNPTVAIDLETGLITGTPTFIGQYVVGICVEEYRNGVLMGITRRDFQFNVTSCQRTITADVREDSLIGPREYLIVSCGEETVTIINESSQVQFIDGYFWEFELVPGDPPFTSTATNPTINFPGLGSYMGTLIVNPGSLNCSDTATIYVDVFPEIKAEYEFLFDPCEPTPIAYTDLSFSGSGTITDWFWDFDDGTFSTDQSPVHLFTEAGTFDVALTVTDINNCQDTYVQTIEWYPESEIMIMPEDDTGCEPFTVTIINNSFPINGYTTEWTLGDGQTSTESSPTHTYEEPGVYTVSIKITSPIGCVSQQTFPDLITVFPTPISDFAFSPDTPTNFDPLVTFSDQSTGAAMWYWDFGTGDFSTQSNPTYSFPDTGRFDVQLVVTHPQGCTDTSVQVVDVEPRFTYFLPNAFTPNYDDVNDGFQGAGIFYGIEQFEMTIWNRWGELIFTANDPNIAWNGKKNNTGGMVKNGVYVYLVKIIGARNQKFEYKGFATVIR